jgi:hypothetical protein
MPTSPSRGPSTHRSGPPTDSPRWQCQKEEGGSHLRTQDKITRAKLERLRSPRLIRRNSKATKLDMQRLQSNTDSSLLATMTNHF